MTPQQLSKIIKIALSVLFLMCLFDMPYGYYQLVRFIGMVGFVFLAYYAYLQQHHQAMILYGALALLFQPFMKIALGREMWNIVDVVVSVALLATLVFPSKNQKR